MNKKLKTFIKIFEKLYINTLKSDMCVSYN